MDLLKWNIEIKCRYCGKLYQVDNIEDISFLITFCFDSNDNLKVKYFYITPCEFCKNKTHTPKKLVPDVVLDEFFSRKNFTEYYFCAIDSCNGCREHVTVRAVNLNNIKKSRVNFMDKFKFKMSCGNCKKVTYIPGKVIDKNFHEIIEEDEGSKCVVS